MRKVFSSQRLETVEGVAALLQGHGIEVRVSNARSYKGGRRREFSFLDRPKESELPAVWIVRVEQQPRAREILREAGLLATTRPGIGPGAGIASGPDARTEPGAYGTLPLASDAAADSPATAPTRRWAWRIRIALLLLIAAVAMVVVTRHRAAPVPTTGTPGTGEGEVRVRVQPATTDTPPSETAPPPVR